MYLPLIDPIDKDHFLSNNKSRDYIDTKSMSLEELMSNISAVKEDTIIRKRLAKGKYKVKGRSFNSSKVLME